MMPAGQRRHRRRSVRHRKRRPVSAAGEERRLQFRGRDLQDGPGAGRARAQSVQGRQALSPDARSAHRLDPHRGRRRDAAHLGRCQPPVYHVEIAAPREVTVEARPEFWTRLDGTHDVRLQRSGRSLVVLPRGRSQRLCRRPEVLPGGADGGPSFADPYRFNTFGNLLECPSLKLKQGALCGAREILRHPHPCPGHADAQAGRPGSRRSSGRRPGRWMRRATGGSIARWWAGFWQRSWIVASDNTLPAEAREKLHGEPSPAGVREEEDGAALAAQSYNVFRFLMACQSRGRIQTKFNGGLFTQQLRVKRADQRRPGRDAAAGRHMAHARGRPPVGPPLHLPEPAAALLAALGQRRLRPDAAVFRLLLEPAADAQGHHQGLVRPRRGLLPRKHRAHGGRAGLRQGRPPAQNQARRKIRGLVSRLLLHQRAGDDRDDARLRRVHRRRGVSRPRAGALRPRDPAVLRPALPARGRRQASPRAGPGDGNLVDRGQSGAGRRRAAVLAWTSCWR